MNVNNFQKAMPCDRDAEQVKCEDSPSAGTQELRCEPALLEATETLLLNFGKGIGGVPLGSAVCNVDYDDIFRDEDVSNRCLYISDDIDEGTVESIAYQIMRYNRIDIDVPKEKRVPIRLYINSRGGSVSDGFGIIDAILHSVTPVYTVNMAMCASMAFLIYIAGSRRFAMPHSQFLMHDGSTMGYDSVAKMKDRMDFETGQLEDMTKQYIMSRTSIDEEMYKRKYLCEWYFLPEEGKKVGAVDAIVGVDCALCDIL